MTSEAQNVFLFVFATMMLAVIVELWSVAKALQRIAAVLETQTSTEGQKGANIS